MTRRRPPPTHSFFPEDDRPQRPPQLDLDAPPTAFRRRLQKLAYLDQLAACVGADGRLDRRILELVAQAMNRKPSWVDVNAGLTFDEAAARYLDWQERRAAAWSESYKDARRKVERRWKEQGGSDTTPADANPDEPPPWQDRPAPRPNKPTKRR
jgi:hypothetical protein